MADVDREAGHGKQDQERHGHEDGDDPALLPSRPVS